VTDWHGNAPDDKGAFPPRTNYILNGHKVGLYFKRFLTERVRMLLQNKFLTEQVRRSTRAVKKRVL
jgi:hypothetical protein